MTSMPRCMARAAHPAPMRPVPAIPMVEILLNQSSYILPPPRGEVENRTLRFSGGGGIAGTTPTPALPTRGRGILIFLLQPQDFATFRWCRHFGAEHFDELHGLFG